jgi:hypothetical protein
VEGDVGVGRGARGARRTAVDAGRADRDVEDAVEAPVTGLHRAVAALAVEAGLRGHALILTYATDRFWRESDTRIASPDVMVATT